MDDRERHLLEANAFMNHNRIQVTEITDQRAVAVLEMGPVSCNPYGCLHGGASFTMADVAGAALARHDGRRYVTLSSHLEFVHAATSGRVTAEASLRHRGRSTCLIDVNITDEAGNLVSCGTFTFFCLGSGGDVPTKT